MRLSRLLSRAISAGQQVIAEQRRRLADLKQKAAVEAQSQWEALHAQPPSPPSYSPLLPHSILHHHHPPGGDPEHAYDTLSLESSDSLDTNLSTSGASACSPDNFSRYRPAVGGGIGWAWPQKTPSPLRLPEQMQGLQEGEGAPSAPTAPHFLPLRGLFGSPRCLGSVWGHRNQLAWRRRGSVQRLCQGTERSGGARGAGPHLLAWLCWRRE